MFPSHVTRSGLHSSEQQNEGGSGIVGACQVWPTFAREDGMTVGGTASSLAVAAAGEREFPLGPVSLMCPKSAAVEGWAASASGLKRSASLVPSCSTTAAMHMQAYTWKCCL